MLNSILNRSRSSSLKSRVHNRSRRRKDRAKIGLEQLEDRSLLCVVVGGNPLCGNNLSIGTELRTFRLAVATTGQYVEELGRAAVGAGVTDVNQIRAAGRTAAAAQIDERVRQLNENYGRELALNFELIPNNNQLLMFDDPATDPWSTRRPTDNADPGGFPEIFHLYSQVPAGIDNILNTAGPNGTPVPYDFGHLFHEGLGGGVGGIGAYKRGVSAPPGIGILRHEMGHQLGGPHTSNSIPVEYGSGAEAGRSMMGGNSLDELHAVTFHQHVTNLNARTTIGTRTPTGNTVPTVDAGPDRSIPRSTPFRLSALSSVRGFGGNTTDANDNDANLTYVWDQIDAGVAGTNTTAPIQNGLVGPLFARLGRTAEPSRVFPRPADMLANRFSTPLEHLPTVGRDLNFRLTVNDNHMFNGRTASGVNSDDIRLTVANDAGPFRVTSQSTAATVAGGATQTVTWDVANTNNANGVNTQNVRILLSTDGGNTFPLVLAETTPNDGSHDVTMPGAFSTQARIKVEAVDNYFFAVNSTNFTIRPNAATSSITATATDGGTAVSEFGGVDTYQVSLGSTPAQGSVTITVRADAQTQVSTDGQNFAATQTLVFNNATPQTVTVRAVQDAAVEGAHTSTITHVVSASGDMINYPVNLPGQTLTANVADAQLPPVVGVDFGPAGSPSPMNWGKIERFGTAAMPTTATNIPLDDGTPTTIDLSVNATACSAYGCAFNSGINGDVPQHTQALRNTVRGIIAARTTAQAVWSGLRPNTNYRVYVFSINPFSNTTIDQSITLRGAGNPITFRQNGGVSRLHVNATQSPAGPLRTVAQEVQSDAQGRITIDGAGREVWWAGLAIQESVPGAGPPPTTTPPGTLTITQTDGNTAVTEGGGTDTYQITPSAAPVGGALTVQVAADAQSQVSTDNGTTFGANATVTFNDVNPQTITVRAVADNAAEGNHNSTITHTIPAANQATNFPQGTAGTVTVNVADPVAGSLAITNTGPNTAVVEGGATDTYQVALRNTPTGNAEVTVTITADAQTQISTDGNEFATTRVLALTNTTPQTITVRAVADTATEGNHTSTITHRVTASNAANYPVGVSANVTANVSDPPATPGAIVVTPSGADTSITEGGATDTYQVALSRAPAAGQTVTVTITADQQSQVSTDGATFDRTRTLTFNNTAAQTVTVRAVADMAMEGNHTSTLRHSVTASNSPSYAVGLNGPNLVANITDAGPMGQPMLVVTQTGGGTAVTEGGQTDTFQVALSTVPTGTVTVEIGSDEQSEMSLDGNTFAVTQTLTFTNTTPQTVTVRAVNDGIVEGTHMDVIFMDVIQTADPGYNGMFFDVNVTISDPQAQPPAAGAVVGVDFDTANSTSVPNNWRRLSALIGQNVTNLSLDDGTATNISLETGAERCGIGGCIFASGFNSSVPQHTQNLRTTIGGVAVARDFAEAVWGGLTPGTSYRVYVFSHNPFGNLNQTTMVYGGGAPVTITQTATQARLAVNGQASGTQALSSFAQVATADGNGEIVIESTGREVFFTALAIQEVPAAATDPSDDFPAGDANFDGRFNSTDLVEVFQIGKYEDDTPGNAGWAEGDWNGDGDFTSSDLVMAFQDGGYLAALRPTRSGFENIAGIASRMVDRAIVQLDRQVADDLESRRGIDDESARYADVTDAAIRAALLRLDAEWEENFGIGGGCGACGGAGCAACAPSSSGSGCGACGGVGCTACAPSESEASISIPDPGASKLRLEDEQLS